MLLVPTLRQPVGSSCGRSQPVAPNPPEALHPAAGRPRRAADPNRRRGASSRRKALAPRERPELRRLVSVPAQERGKLLVRQPVQERGKLQVRQPARDPKRSRQLTPAPVLVLFPQALT